AVVGGEVDAQRAVVRDGAAAGRHDGQRDRGGGADLDGGVGCAQLVVVVGPRRDRRGRGHHREQEPGAGAHRIWVASSASCERSPLARMTWPAIASGLNFSATVVRPLFEESRYG